MLLRLTVVLFLLGTVPAHAQFMKYTKLLKNYNQKLDSIAQLLRQRNATTALNVISANNGIYQKLIELDTAAAKPLFEENVANMDIFLELLKSDTASDKTLESGTRSFYKDATWYNSQLSNAALESCPECYLTRKVNITVLERVSAQQLDTVKCATVECIKLLLNGQPSKKQTITSSPCPEAETMLSTGPKYQFVVTYGNRKEVIERPVNIGSALTDIQKISLIVPKQ